MSPNLNRRIGLVLATGALACGAAAPAANAEGPAGEGPLSPELATLAQPAVQALPAAGRAAVIGTPAGGLGSFLGAGGSARVEVRFEAGAIARLPALRGAGATVLAASAPLQSVTASVPAAALQAVAAVPGVASVSASPAPILHGDVVAAAVSAGSCEGGSVISEGVGQLNVGSAREAFGLRGRGVTVGILSDSYDSASEAESGGAIASHAGEDIASGDLPGSAGTCSAQQAPVRVLEEFPAAEAEAATDEGRGMLQVVHDVAPHAELAFATAFAGESAFAANIERLARPVLAGGAGAQVIADDVSYFEEPFFQNGPVAQAVERVTAAGATYLSAAGNENAFQGGRETIPGEAGISSWEAPAFRSATSCPAVLALPSPQCMNFATSGNDSEFGITVEPGSSLAVDLQWAEPWFGVDSDLNAFLLNSAGTKVLAASKKNNLKTQKPFELPAWENTSTSSVEVHLVIDRCAETCNAAAGAALPRLKFILIGGVSKTEYPRSSGSDVVGPTIYGHSAARGAIAVAAIPFNSTSKPEEYSSRGPVTLRFGPVAGTIAATALAAPETLEKPDVTATDCGATTFFAQLIGSAWRFCGTSEAAPHAAGVAALMKQGSPAASPDAIKEALEESALPVGVFAPSAVGAGLLDAAAALRAVGATPTTEDGPSNAASLVAPETPATPETPEAPAVLPPATPAPVQPVAPAAAPTTTIVKHPRRIVLIRRSRARVVFGFASDTPGARFECRLGGRAWRSCGARVAIVVRPGARLVRARALNAAGTADGSPAVYRFRVRRRR